MMITIFNVVLACDICSNKKMQAHNFIFKHFLFIDEMEIRASNCLINMKYITIISCSSEEIKRCFSRSSNLSLISLILFQLIFVCIERSFYGQKTIFRHLEFSLIYDEKFHLILRIQILCISVRF